MSSDSRAAEAARLGNIREAIECLFNEGGVDPARRPTFFVDRISAWSEGAALGGALAADRHLREAVLEVYRRARVDVPDSVHRLCASPEGAVGLAVFPVVVMDGRKYTGALRAIEVSVDTRETRHPVDDEDFVRAVERARHLALARCGGDTKTRVREARWRILPDLSSNANLGDGSVALAAFVAFVSFALGEPVPATIAFTGVLNGRSFTFPSPATFDEKRRALRERAAIATLFWPEWSGTADDLVEREARIDRLLARAFQQPWDDLAHRLFATQGLTAGMARWMPLVGGLAIVAGGAWWLRMRSAALGPEATIARSTEGSPSPSMSAFSSTAPTVTLPAAPTIAPNSSSDGVVLSPHLRPSSAVSGARAVGAPSSGTSTISTGAAVSVKAARTALAARDGNACLAAFDLHDQGEPDGDLRSNNPKSDLAQDRACCMMLAGQCDAGRALLGRIDDANPTPGLPLEQREKITDFTVGRCCQGTNLSRRDEVQRAWWQLTNGASAGGAATCKKAFDKLKALGAFTGEVRPTDPTKLSAVSAETAAAQCFARAGDCAASFKAYEELHGMWISTQRGIPDPEQARTNFELVVHACKGKP